MGDMTPGQAAYEAHYGAWGVEWGRLSTDSRAWWEHIAQAAIDASAPATSDDSPPFTPRESTDLAARGFERVNRHGDADV